jgi:hypothetical protein
MNRVVSVDKSLLASGTVKWFVTMEDENGNRSRVEVGEAEAQRFQSVLRSQQGTGGRRLLTETLP